MIHEYELTVSYNFSLEGVTIHRVYQCIHYTIESCVNKIAELAKDHELEFVVITPFKSGDSDATI